MLELEEEIDHPTGITTVRKPDMKINAVLVSKNCAMLYELKGITGMKWVILRSSWALCSRLTGQTPCIAR